MTECFVFLWAHRNPLLCKDMWMPSLEWQYVPEHIHIHHYTYKKILAPTQRFEEGPQNYGKYFMPPKAMVLRRLVTLLRAAGASCRFGFVCLGLGMVRTPGMKKSPRMLLSQAFARCLGGLIWGVGYAEWFWFQRFCLDSWKDWTFEFLSEYRGFIYMVLFYFW